MSPAKKVWMRGSGPSKHKGLCAPRQMVISRCKLQMHWNVSAHAWKTIFCIFLLIDLHFLASQLPLASPWGCSLLPTA